MEPVYVVHVEAGRSGDLAWAEAVRRARHTGARLVALKVTAPASKAQRHEMDVEHERFAMRASADGVIGARIVVTSGDPGEAIVRAADDFDAALVILGDGSPADRVIRRAHCAALVVRDVPETGIVVGGTDFSDAALPVVSATCAEADLRGGRAIVAHSREPIETLTWTAYTESSEETIEHARTAAESQLRRVLGGYPLAEPAVIEGPPGAALADLAKTVGAELLVVGTIGRAGLPRFLLGNVAEDAVRQAPCSVLVVRLHRS